MKYSMCHSYYVPEIDWITTHLHCRRENTSISNKYFLEYTKYILS